MKALYHILKCCSSVSMTLQHQRMISIYTRLKTSSQLQMKFKQRIPRTMEEMTELVNKKVTSPEESRLIKVAMIGVPNSGKSTLINNISGWKVNMVSKKVHTTQKNTQTICNTGVTQLIMYDAPGVITPKEYTQHKVGVKSHLNDPELCFREVDLIAVIHDVSNHHTRENLHPYVIKLLALYPHVPAVLILNKIDALKRSFATLLRTTYCLTYGKLRNEPACEIEEIKIRLTDNEVRNKLLYNKSLSTNRFKPESSPYFYNTKQPGHLALEGEEVNSSETTSLLADKNVDIEDVIEGKIQLTEHEAIRFGQQQTGWPMFQEVFMVSGKTGNGLEDVKQYFLACAYSSPWVYNHEMVTNLDPFEIVRLTLREKFLDVLPNEIPYLLSFEVENWNLTSSEVLEIAVVVKCPRQTQVKLVMKKGISKITEAAAQEMRNIFCCEVLLEVYIKSDQVRKLPHWRRRIVDSRKGNRLSLLKKLNSSNNLEETI